MKRYKRIANSKNNLKENHDKYKFIKCLRLGSLLTQPLTDHKYCFIVQLDFLSLSLRRTYCVDYSNFFPAKFFNTEKSKIGKNKSWLRAMNVRRFLFLLSSKSIFSPNRAVLTQLLFFFSLFFFFPFFFSFFLYTLRREN